MISRLFHANDNEAIATWRLKLDGILDVFNVRSITFRWSSLTSRFQTELGINTHATVSDNHDTTNAGTAVPSAGHDVSKTHAIISEVRSDVTNTRNMLTSREDTDGRNQGVSITRALPVTE